VRIAIRCRGFGALVMPEPAPRTAAAATDFVTRGPGHRSTKAGPRLSNQWLPLTGGSWAGCRNHQIGQQPTYAIMNPLRNVKFLWPI
jgi:hypothetical protein